LDLQKNYRLWDVIRKRHWAEEDEENK